MRSQGERQEQVAHDPETRGVTGGVMPPPATPAAASPLVTTNQVLPAEKMPLDAEGEELASSTARLINMLWGHPIMRAETTELYTTLPRPSKPGDRDHPTFQSEG